MPMPTEPTYTIADLADLASVTPRTIRYYIAQGLLPGPDQVGRGATYGDAHLARLRLIRKLAREHLPLAEIRSRLEGLNDADVLALEPAPAPEPPPPDSALDYIRSVLAVPEPSAELRRLAEPRARLRLESGPWPALPAMPAAPPGTPAPSTDEATTEPSGTPLTRSQWDRVSLAPDIELHVRRPLSRHQNRRVERLIAIARELLKEDQP